MPVVLGTDASACVLRDGRIVVAVAEGGSGRGTSTTRDSRRASLSKRCERRRSASPTSISWRWATIHGPMPKARYALGHPAQVLRAARAFGQRTACLSDLRSEIAERC